MKEKVKEEIAYLKQWLFSFLIAIFGIIAWLFNSDKEIDCKKNDIFDWLLNNYLQWIDCNSFFACLFITFCFIVVIVLHLVIKNKFKKWK